MCRSSKLADYTLEHNARIGRAVLDAGQPKGAPAPRRVLIGHSLGGVCAALEALRSPQACRLPFSSNILLKLGLKA